MRSQSMGLVDSTGQYDLIVRAMATTKPFKMYSARMKNKCEKENKKNQ